VNLIASSFAPIVDQVRAVPFDAAMDPEAQQSNVDPFAAAVPV